MKTAPSDGHTIEGKQLTAWTVLSGGTHVGLDFSDRDGTARRIVLPFDVLTGLLTTLSRMLRTTLDTR